VECAALSSPGLNSIRELPLTVYSRRASTSAGKMKEMINSSNDLLRPEPKAIVPYYSLEPPEVLFLVENFSCSKPGQYSVARPYTATDECIR